MTFLYKISALIPWCLIQYLLQKSHTVNKQLSSATLQHLSWIFLLWSSSATRGWWVEENLWRHRTDVCEAALNALAFFMDCFCCVTFNLVDGAKLARQEVNPGIRNGSSCNKVLVPGNLNLRGGLQRGRIKSACKGKQKQDKVSALGPFWSHSYTPALVF